MLATVLDKQNVWFFTKEDTKISNFQKTMLDEIEQELDIELKNNGFVKTISIEESYNKITNFINNN